MPIGTPPVVLPEGAAAAALYGDAIGLAALQAAWRKWADRRPGAPPGPDAATRRQLERLHADLANGTYRPQAPRRLDIPKPGGGVRCLTIPTLRDRIAQSSVARALSAHVEPLLSPASFGYRPGRSTTTAAEAILRWRRMGYRSVVEGDIARFFDSVEHPRLLRALEREPGGGPAGAFIADWLRIAAPGGIGLAQGSPLSPVLSNILLDRFDRMLNGPGMRLVRFADDFVLLCAGEAKAREARDLAADALAALGLALNAEKTRFACFREGFSFVGHRFVGPHALDPRRAVPVPGTRDGAPEAGDPAAEAPGATEEEGLARRAMPVLRVLYIVMPRRRLAARGQAFVVLEDEREVAVIPAGELDRIEIGPGIGATTAALRLGFARGIPIAFLDGRGATTGVCGPEPSHRAALHLAQARCVLDPSRRLDLARRIVLGRIHNQRALLHRLNRRRGDGAVQAAFERLRDVEAKARHAQGVDGLLGLEGHAAALYWPAWAGMLARGWEFGGRSRRPPEDPLNALLSYLSGILHRDLLALAGRHGLHPGFGALHGTRDGHVGCISDLIEEFRAPLIEGLATYLVNNRHLSPEMFVRRDCGGWRIVTIGHQRIVGGYERWLHRPVRSPRSGRDIQWRRVLEEQVVAYARHVRGVADYRPYRMGY